MRTQNILTDEHLQAIGLVTAEWAELEYYLHATIWALAETKSPGIGNAMTDHLRAVQLSNVLESIGYDRFGKSPEYEDIRTISKEIRRLYDERNKYAHAKWQKYGSDNQVYRMNRRHQKRLSAGWDAVNVKEIIKIAQEISDLTAQLDRLFFAHEPETWPDTQNIPD